MQPNNQYISCCGEADAFEADAFEVAGAQYVAIITNGKGSSRTERESLFRTKQRDEGNPTGHGIIFVDTNGQVYCHATPRWDLRLVRNGSFRRYFAPSLEEASG
jgi:hypothetical protein